MSEKINIFWVSPHCWPSDMLRPGGLRTEFSQGGQTGVMYFQTIELAKAIPNLHIDIFARYQNLPGENEAKVTILHERVREVKFPCGPVDRYIPKEDLWDYIPGFVQSIIDFAKKEEINYKLCHGHYADGWMVVRMIKEIWPEIASYVTTHSMGRRKRDDSLYRKEFEGELEKLDKKYNFIRRIVEESRALKIVDRVCPLSSVEKEYMRHHYCDCLYGTDRIRITPNGINIDIFEKTLEEDLLELRKKLKLQGDEKIVFIPARIDPRKGIKNIVLAAPPIIKEMEKQGKKVKFLLVTWPEKHDEYSLLVENLMKEYGIEDYFIKHPSVPHKRMGLYFDFSTLVLQPSQEYFSLVTVEAMLKGKPVITSKYNGARDAITPGVDGFLIDHTDINDIARVTEVLSMDDEKLKKVGEDARKKVLEGYTWEKVTKKLIEYYAETVSDFR